MTTPRVSIITPCYNARRYLPATWRSIRGQSFTDWEWIVWDDGSTDGSLAWLRDLAERDARVRVLHGERTTSAGAGRNRCVPHARGDLLAFLDADDLWHRHKLAAQVAQLDASPEVDITYTHLREFWSEPPATDEPPPRVWPRHALAPRAAARLLAFGNPAAPSTIMVRRAAFARIGPFHENLAGLEDFEFMARAATRARIRRTPGVLAGYRIHAANMSLGMQQRFDPHERLLACLRELPTFAGAARRAYLSTFHLRRAEYTLEAKIPGNFRGDIVRAVMLAPTNAARWIPLVLVPLPRGAALVGYTLLKRLQVVVSRRRAPAHRMASRWR